MSFILQDGTGNSFSAKVNEFNQIHTFTESLPSEGAQAQEGKAFIIHVECHTAAAASGGLLYIKNNDENFNLEVTRIYIDPHTITPTDLIITQVFDPTITSGTDYSSSAVVNKNRGKFESFNLSVTASDGSLDMTYTGGTQYHAFPVKDMTAIQRNMQGTNILVKNNAILWGFKTRSGGNATDGEIVSFSVNVIKRKL